MEPTEKDLASPEFEAVWQAIKGWDIERAPGEGFAHATGTDVMAILNALRSLNAEEFAASLPPQVVYYAAIRLGVYATTGEYSNQEVPALYFVEALKRWEEGHRK